MKNPSAMALCLAGVFWLCGVGMAASLDMTPATVVHEEASHNTETEGFETPRATLMPPAPVEKTGQTKSYGRRDDGALKKGIAWPKPRFKDNKDGTVTDNLTGLRWLKKASCLVFYDGDTTGSNKRDWNKALDGANKLKSGACGLTDNSVAGNWRLPNRKEMLSLLDDGFNDPAIPNTEGTGRWTAGNPFSGVQSGNYWSSTTHAYYTSCAWFLNLSDGYAHYDTKTNTYYVWPVRGE